MYTAAFVKKKKKSGRNNPNYNEIKGAVYLVSSLP